jgi:uncharacterized membrane protein YagU involved in acid resistance
MKKIYAAWIFIVGGLILALVFIGLNINMENKAYRSLENDMVEAAHKYIINNGIDLSNGESIKLQDDLLLRSEVLTSMILSEQQSIALLNMLSSYVPENAVNDSTLFIPNTNDSSSTFPLPSV